MASGTSSSKARKAALILADDGDLRGLLLQASLCIPSKCLGRVHGQVRFWTELHSQCYM